jgi:hypothetical protein
MAAVRVYKGPFGAEQAERLLWRAGFGPRRGQGARLVKLYGAILEQWLGADAQALIPGARSFARPRILR